MSGEKDPVRRFSEDQRQALFELSGGRCESCGIELDRSFHGDHVIPHSAGGRTDVVNGQALCASCNAKKGVTVNQARTWQIRCVDDYFEKALRDYLVVATPGSGKTRLALEIVERLIGERVDSVIVVVPTENLKEQWKDNAAKCQIQLNPDWTNGDLKFSKGRLPNDFHGIALTYAQAFNGAELLRGLCSRSRSLVIFDEIHHCGDSGKGNPKEGWGEAIKYAFDPTLRRLGLSGTPFRSDNNAIPFVRYVDGVGQADFSYGYAEAIRDGVCRPVFFPKFNGTMEWEGYSGYQKATFDDDLNQRLQSERLRAALDPSGNWMSDVIHQAHTQLVELREDDPDAAGMIIATDIIHARRIASLCATEIGIEPAYIASDDSDSAKRLKAFKLSQEPWAVSVKMVSEGVDIPRLRVGVYATNTTTELFFRQAVGRLVRVEGGIDDTAFFYIPDDCVLREWATRIKEERDHQLDQELDAESEGLGKGSEKELSRFHLISSLATGAGSVADGSLLSISELELARRIRLSDSSFRKFSPEEIALLGRKFRESGGSIPGFTADETVQPLADRIRDLKSKNNWTVRRIVGKWNLTYKDVNDELNATVGIPSINSSNCSETILLNRLDKARKYHRDGNL